MRTTCESALGDHGPAWDALVDQSPRPSPFLYSWWLEAVMTPTATPKFVLIFDGDELIGGIALEESLWHGVPQLQLIGTGPLEPDHLDLVACQSKAAIVSAAVWQWIERSSAKIIDFQALDEDALLLTTSAHRKSAEGMVIAPFAEMPAG